MTENEFRIRKLQEANRELRKHCERLEKLYRDARAQLREEITLGEYATGDDYAAARTKHDEATDAAIAAAREG